mmetsp:Transcript_1504/g.5312  ORF Transcript_1504/g.5312 Transcript_1504/m.5312 type:complete len:311 (-) Transcript_1504:54-986(-)
MLDVVRDLGLHERRQLLAVAVGARHSLPALLVGGPAPAEGHVPPLHAAANRLLVEHQEHPLLQGGLLAAGRRLALLAPPLRPHLLRTPHVGARLHEVEGALLALAVRRRQPRVERRAHCRLALGLLRHLGEEGRALHAAVDLQLPQLALRRKGSLVVHVGHLPPRHLRLHPLPRSLELCVSPSAPPAGRRDARARQPRLHGALLLPQRLHLVQLRLVRPQLRLQARQVQAKRRRRTSRLGRGAVGGRRRCPPLWSAAVIAAVYPLAASVSVSSQALPLSIAAAVLLLLALPLPRRRIAAPSRSVRHLIPS